MCNFVILSKITYHQDCESCSRVWEILFIYSESTLNTDLNDGSLKKIVSVCQKFWFSKVKMFRKTTMIDWQGRTSFLLGGIWCTTFHWYFSTPLNNPINIIIIDFEYILYSLQFLLHFIVDYVHSAMGTLIKYQKNQNPECSEPWRSVPIRRLSLKAILYQLELNWRTLVFSPVDPS